MYDGWFMPLLQHRLQICNNGGTTSSSGPARCEAVLHGYGTIPLEEEVGGEGLHRLVTVRTHGDFIVLPHSNTRLLVP